MTRARLVLFVFFFFQAEDGIRAWSVTGVQTCALPISVTELVAPIVSPIAEAVGPVVTPVTEAVDPVTQPPIAQPVTRPGAVVVPPAGGSDVQQPPSASSTSVPAPVPPSLQAVPAAGPEAGPAVPAAGSVDVPVDRTLETVSGTRTMEPARRHQSTPAPVLGTPEYPYLFTTSYPGHLVRAADS